MDDFDKAALEQMRARITAIEYVLEHMFAWMLIEGGVDGEAVLDDLLTPRPTSLPPGALMDASQYQTIETADRRQLEALCKKLRERYRDLL